MHHTVFRCSKSSRGGQDGVLDILRKHVSVAETDRNQSGQLTFVFYCAHNIVSGSRFRFSFNFFCASTMMTPFLISRMEDMDESSDFRADRRLLYNAKRRMAVEGNRETRDGELQEGSNFSLELGVHYYTFWSSAFPWRREHCQRLTNFYTPENIALILAMGIWGEIHIHFLLCCKTVSSSTSDLISRALSNSMNLKCLDLYGSYSFGRSTFCLNIHATQLGRSLVNKPLKCLRIERVVQEVASAILPVVSSDACELERLAWKDDYILGNNPNNLRCANMEELSSVLTACRERHTLQELCIGTFRDSGVGEPRTDILAQIGSLVGTLTNLKRLELDVPSSASLMGLIPCLIGNKSLEELKITDNRNNLKEKISKSKPTFH